MKDDLQAKQLPASRRTNVLYSGQCQPLANGQLIQSIPDAIAKVLETHVGKVNTHHQDMSGLHCPICGSSITDEKCPTCANCGWSKCNGV